MTEVTHGADPEALDHAGRALAELGQRTQDVSQELGAVSGVLGESWAGRDAEMLLAQVGELRPQVERTGAALVAFAGVAVAQAAEQRAVSGEVSGGARGSAGGGPGGLKGAAERFAGQTAQGVGKATGRASGLADALRDQIDRGAARAGLTPGDLLNDDLPEGTVTGTQEHGLVRESGFVSRDESSGVDGEGRATKTSTVTTGYELGIGEDGKLGKVTVDAEVHGGSDVSLEVTRLADSGFDPRDADPTDPLALPEGTSIRMGASAYAGWGLSATYNELITASASGSEGTEYSVEVQRGPGDTVTVTVGPTDFINRKDSLGLGNDHAGVSVGTGSRSEQFTATEVSFDMSDPAARKAYEDLVFRGVVPESTGGGVSDIVKTEGGAITKDTSLSATVGPYAREWGMTTSDFNHVTREHADGTRTAEWSTQLAEGKTLTVEHQYDKNGEVDVSRNQYTIVSESVSADRINSYNQLYSGDAERVDSSRAVVVSYSHDDLSQLRQQAASVTADRINETPQFYPDFPRVSDRPVTAVDVLNHMQDEPFRHQHHIAPFNRDPAIVLSTTDNADLAHRIGASPHGGDGLPAQLAADYNASKGHPPPSVGRVRTVDNGG